MRRKKKEERVFLTVKEFKELSETSAMTIAEEKYTLDNVMNLMEVEAEAGYSNLTIPFISNDVYKYLKDNGFSVKERENSIVISWR